MSRTKLLPRLQLQSVGLLSFSSVLSCWQPSPLDPLTLLLLAVPLLLVTVPPLLLTVPLLLLTVPAGWH